jgi:RND family efflux transporter MFP subunit
VSRAGATAAVLLAAAVACGGGSGRADSPPTRAAVPVRTARAARATLLETVAGPGRTEAVKQLRLRAPFTGTLAALRVTDGDRVAQGQELAAIVSRNSAAALAGARAMLDAARTPAESSDARRALKLAERELVRAPLRAPEAGVVVSHAANEGDLVNEGDDILTIAAAGSVVFVAQIAQSDLARVRPGQPATIELAARPRPLRGVVRALLPAASSDNLTAPVRIDFAPGGAPAALGLFGTARITVGERRDVLVVPAAAVLRDDVYGTSRVAVVRPDGTAHWVAVTPGLRQGDALEIAASAAPIAPGTAVIVAGQVGLPEGAAVQEQP